MQTLRTLILGALIAAALPACSKHNGESPANPPTGTETKTTPDTGGTGTAATLTPERPTPPSPATAGAGTGAGNSDSGATGGSAATQGTQSMPPAAGDTPGTSAPPRKEQPGR